MTKEEFKKLTSEYLRAELWEDLTDADVFGVELENGRIAYCCVMGNSGIHKGLGIYVGKRGFRTYLDQISNYHYIIKWAEQLNCSAHFVLYRVIGFTLCWRSRHRWP